MPFDLKEFDTRKPDYEDQFYFFRLLFIDTEVPKTTEENINIGFCALYALSHMNHHEWILPEYIEEIQAELLRIVTPYSYEELRKITQREIPEELEFIRLMRIFKVIYLLEKSRL